MTDNIRVTDLPDGGCSVELDGETIQYTKAEVDEMEQDYLAIVERRAGRW